MSRFGTSRNDRGRAGFTLVEMLLATMLVGVLTALSMLTFQSVSRSWQVSTDYLDKMQRTDYALEQVTSGLLSLYYPHGGSQVAEYGFALTNRGDGDRPDKSDVIEWSKVGPALVGTKNALANKVHRIQLMVLEEGNNDYAEPIRKTGLYARISPDAAPLAKKNADGKDYTLGNLELHQPFLVVDGVDGFNCRVMKSKDNAFLSDGRNNKDAFEDEFTESNAVPYKVELTFYVEREDERFRSQRRRIPSVRIVRLPIHEQSLDGAAPPSATEQDGKKTGN